MTILEETLSEAEARRLEGRWDDALALLDGTLATARGLGAAEHGRTLIATARTLVDASTFGDRPAESRAETTLTELEQLADDSGDRALLAAALDLRGRILHSRFLADRSAGEPDGELALFERGLELRDPSDTRGVAESLFHVGLVHQVVRGDEQTAQPYFGAAALALAEFEGEQGRPDRARELLALAREVFERVPMRRFLDIAGEVERDLVARAP